MCRPVFFVLALMAGFLALAPAPHAQDSLQIIAVVNEATAAGLYVILDRMQLIIHSTGLQDTAEVRARLAPQVLRALIDERLKRGEAKRLGITANRAEVERALSQIAQQNGMTIDQFNQAVRQDERQRLADPPRRPTSPGTSWWRPSWGPR